MSGDTDFLDDFAEDEVTDSVVEEVASSPAEPISEETPIETETKGDGPARGPDGKFVKKEAEQAAEAVEKGVKDDLAEAPPADSEGTMVPVSVVQKMREEIKALKAQTPDTKSNAPEMIAPVPTDFQNDPVAAFQGQLHNQKMQMSQHMATQEHDAETVSQAWIAFDEACQRDPAVSALSYQLINHPHPLGEMVKWHKQQQEVSLLRDAGGLDALIEQKLAERMANPAQQQVTTPGAKPHTPPSLAKRGGANQGMEIEGEDDFFDATFKR